MATKPFIVGIAGGSSAGKAKVCDVIKQRLEAHGHAGEKISILHLASFYKEPTDETRSLVERSKFNFDHPEAFDFERLGATLDNLISGKPATLYRFDSVSRLLTEETSVIRPGEVVLLEGILILYEKFIRAKLDMKIFVDVDSDKRLATKVLEDVQVKGRNIDNVLNEYITYVKPAFEDFIFPTKKFADVILPRGSENEVAIDLIVKHLLEKLDSVPRAKGTRVFQLENSTLDNSNLFSPVFK